MASYTDAWTRRAQAKPQTPLVSERDPQHLEADPGQEFVGRPPTWQADVMSPSLPFDMIDQGGGSGDMPTGIGPLDQTPQDHLWGMGGGHGEATLQAQDRRSEWHGRDAGAVAAGSWHPLTDRDGSPEVAWVDHVPGDGESPRTTQMQRTGVGIPHDPNAAPGRRLQRWWYRYHEMHRWDSQPGVTGDRYARPTPGRAPVDGSSIMPHSGNIVVDRGAAPPDRFVGQLVRREPGRWDEPLSTDATASTMVGATDNYGLGSWGL